MKLTPDGWTGLAVLAAGATLFALTLELPDNPLVPIGPGFYPRIVLGITLALAAAVLALSLRGPASGEKRSANYRRAMALFAIFFLYVGALPLIGFRIATFAFVAAAQGTLEPPRGAKAWALLAASALITTAVTYVLFESYLQVLLPRGRWTGL